MASAQGHSGVVQILLNAGADVQHAGLWGTSLDEALEENQVDVVNILKAHAGVYTVE